MKRILCGIVLLTSFCACGVYNQNIMFKTKESVINNDKNIELAVLSAEGNYLIQKNDYIEVRVYDNQGEIIVTPPNPDSLGNYTGIIGIQTPPNDPANSNPNNGFQTQRPLIFPSFLIDQAGNCKLPLVGTVRLEGLSLNQADSLLESRYEEYYQAPFVRTRYSNKRVIVFKGTEGIIYPLRNEKVNLIEVLAATGGMGNDLRSSNIRLIRGDLQNPTVLKINLKELSGLRRYDLTVLPNDIIYVEPVRKTFVESLRDISPFLSVVSTVLTVILLINR